MKLIRFAAAAALVALSCGTAAAQSTLRIGLAEDPDVLDPTLARTYVGRIVFASICDKLFDIDEKLAVVPQLALGQGRRGGGRQVRPEAGLRRPVQVRRAGPAGPHRRREVRRLLEQGQYLRR